MENKQFQLADGIMPTMLAIPSQSSLGLYLKLMFGACNDGDSVAPSTMLTKCKPLTNTMLGCLLTLLVVNYRENARCCKLYLFL